jgi:hypothetical protein
MAKSPSTGVGMDALKALKKGDTLAMPIARSAERVYVVADNTLILNNSIGLMEFGFLRSESTPIAQKLKVVGDVSQTGVSVSAMEYDMVSELFELARVAMTLDGATDFAAAILGHAISSGAMTLDSVKAKLAIRGIQ